MRRLKQNFKNLKISYKLNLSVVGMFAFLILLIILMLQIGSARLADRISQTRAGDEVKLIQGRLAEAESNLLAETKLLASTPGLNTAVADGDTEAIRTLILTGSAALDITEVDVFNADGVRLVTVSRTATSSQGEFDGDENRLLGLSLLGIETTDLVVMQEDEGNTVLAYGATVPLRDPQGAIVGGLIVKHKMDDEFLEDINFGRSGVQLFLLYQGEVIAHSQAHSDQTPSDDELFDNVIRTFTPTGKVIIAQEPVEIASAAFARADIPVKENDARMNIAVLVDMTQFFSFQRQVKLGLIPALSLLGVISVAALSFITNHSITHPLRKLQEVAERMAEGNYWRRATVYSGDEIGQLAAALNIMSKAVQSRETDFQNLSNSLEEQVEARTAELRKQAVSLAGANRELAIARRQAEDANRLKSEFLSTMSHELRTPLNAINGYTQIMLAGMSGEFNDEQQGYLDRIWLNGKHLLSLINDLLDLAKIEAGRIEVVKEPVDLQDWLDVVTGQVRGLAEEKHLDFEVVLDERMPPVIVGDSARLTQVLLNLLSNAIKFTEEGSVRLTVRRQGKARWEISVSDTGVGIPSHAQEYIFDEFRQIDGSSQRKHGGTGLGLAIVRNLCLLMGGNVRIKSEVGQGSTFTVLLPLDAVAEKVS